MTHEKLGFYAYLREPLVKREWNFFDYTDFGEKVLGSGSAVKNPEGVRHADPGQRPGLVCSPIQGSAMVFIIFLVFPDFSLL